MMDSVISQEEGSNSIYSPRVSNNSEMLFLKRLLYLKASIDTDQSIHTYSVPLEQEKKMGLATAEELGISSPKGLFSGGRISTAYDSLDPSGGLNSVQGRMGYLPNTSHGHRTRANNRTMISPDNVGVRVTNSLNLSQNQEFDTRADLKKV